MTNCCDLCRTLVLVFAAVLISIGSLQAQSQPNCDLSKCSPEEQAECAKRCTSTASLASLTNFLTETKTENKKCNPANCNPADCKKVPTATAKLVSIQTKGAAVYRDNLEENVNEVAVKSTKKCCATKCRK